MGAPLRAVLLTVPAVLAFVGARAAAAPMLAATTLLIVLSPRYHDVTGTIPRAAPQPPAISSIPARGR